MAKKTGIELPKEKKFENKTFDMKVRSITKIEREKENSETTMHRLMARDADGINEITIVSASPFVGINANGANIIQVVLRQSQKSLEDFKEKDSDSK